MRADRRLRRRRRLRPLRRRDDLHGAVVQRRPPRTPPAPATASAPAARRACRSAPPTAAATAPASPAAPATPTASAGQVCQNGSCGPKPNGQPCAAAGECVSNFCVDGVCCDEACGGACRSCALPSSMGRCVPVAGGRRRSAQRLRRQGRGQLRHRRQMRRRVRLPQVPSRERSAPPRAATNGVYTPPAACSATRHLRRAQRQRLRAVRLQRRPLLRRLHGRRQLRGRQGLPRQLVRPQAERRVLRRQARVRVGQLRPGRLLRHRLRQRLQVVRAARVDGHLHQRPRRTARSHRHLPRRRRRQLRQQRQVPGGRLPELRAGHALPARHLSRRARPPSRPAGSCDGAGTCSAPAATSCFPFRCGAAACKSTCTADADCAPPGVCSGGSCGLKPDGAVCARRLRMRERHLRPGRLLQDRLRGHLHVVRAARAAPGTCKPVAAGAPRSRRPVPRSGGGDLREQRRLRRRGRLPAVRGGHASARRRPARPARRRRRWRARATARAPASRRRPSRARPTTATARPAARPAPATPTASRGTVCNSGSCGKKRLGQICAAGSECDSGNCVDGVCCSSASCGTCASCNVTGSAGSCRPVPAGAMEPHGGCAAAPPCGFNGTCDGNGACRPMPAGTICGAASCSGSTSTPAGSCDGAGTCRQSPVSCSPYLCGANALQDDVRRERGLRRRLHLPGQLVHEPQAERRWPAARRANASAATAPRGSAADRRRAAACHSCAVPGKQGTCSPIADGTVCGARHRATATTGSTRRRPASAGTCDAGTRIDCAPYGCDAAAGCKTSCAATATARRSTSARWRRRRLRLRRSLTAPGPQRSLRS